MFHLSRKFVAVLLAIWLPLFSGSALATSVAMTTTSSDCHPVTSQANEGTAQQATVLHHYSQNSENQKHTTGQLDQQSSSCADCGVCHFACSGYLATIAIPAIETQIVAQTYAIFVAQFQSFTSAPLDPPPFSRV